MSVNRDMKKYVLQKSELIQTESGAGKENWVTKGVIEVAVYKKNDIKVIMSEKYMESTHTGLTHFRELEANGYRLVKDGVVYEITDCNTEGRLTNLLLKVVNK